MQVSEEVLRVVHKVERLPREDQDKILKMVDLLTLVPVGVRDESQRMLRELLARDPSTKSECVAGARRRHRVSRTQRAALGSAPELSCEDQALGRR